ncbi:transcriptional regulator GcvA [Caballeronia sordidicola]|uniref:transcriptional regulator GcvA n=1 Tax=Caballeronia sordidicola TaxID=196367 RepID=UPI000A3A2990|nr:transcriptional regulator GcvA [Caballeronia sordidicola]
MRSPRPIPSLLSLHVFEAVARHLSFTDAAQELNVTQSAVSHHIKKLEDELGRLLFERRTRSVALTDSGQAYYEQVHEAFELLRCGTEEIRGPLGATGTLTVGLLASFATRWLAPRLSAFYADYPNIDLRLRPDITLAKVSQGDVDVATRYGRGSWPGLHAQKLMSERLTAVCAPSLLASLGRFEKPKDLLGVPILVSHTGKPFEWTTWADRFGLDMSDAKTVQLHDYNIVVEAALAGQGIAMGRHRLIETQLTNGTLVHALPEATLDDPYIGWWLVTPRGPRSEAASAFCDWLTAATNEDARKDTD